MGTVFAKRQGLVLGITSQIAKVTCLGLPIFKETELVMTISLVRAAIKRMSLP